MQDLPLPLVDAALRGTVLALCLLLAAILWRDRPQLPAARAGVLMVLGLAVQVIGATPLLEAQLPRGWLAPFVAVSVANSVLFWIFVQALFDDDFALRPVHVAAWAGVAGLTALNCALLAGSGSVLASISVAVQRAVPLVCAVLAARAALAQWRTDLVEGRRRLRGFILVAGVGYTLVMLAARLGSPRGQLSALAATADVAMLVILLGVVAVGLLRLGGSELFPQAHPLPLPLSLPAEPAAPAPDPADLRLADALQRLMTEQRAYRNEDLTIAGLAAQLAVPEYRLRRVINRQLGHRNFNAFINGHRLAEAQALLADPARRELPVLGIALDAGFQSIGPFNRAFKAATGLTPTEYRRQQLADS